MNQDRLILALAERVFAQSELLSKRAERHKPMSDVEDYQTAIRTILIAGRMIDQLDLDAVMNAIVHAETTGPIYDPSLWIKKSEALSQDKEIIRAALPLKRLMGIINEYHKQKAEPK